MRADPGRDSLTRLRSAVGPWCLVAEHRTERPHAFHRFVLSAQDSTHVFERGVEPLRALATNPLSRDKGRSDYECGRVLVESPSRPIPVSVRRQGLDRGSWERSVFPLRSFGSKASISASENACPRTRVVRRLSGARAEVPKPPVLGMSDLTSGSASADYEPCTPQKPEWGS